MQELPGYRLNQTLYQDKTIQFSRGMRQSDRKTVLVRQLLGRRPTYLALAHLKNEHAVTARLELRGVLEPLELIEREYHTALVYEDFDGQILDPKSFWTEHGLEGFLRLSANLADLLSELHQREVVHQCLAPRNILFNPRTYDIRLVGFRLASSPDAVIVDRDLEVYHEALTFMAPEQTGRLNIPVGHYADFYGLGVTLYSLIQGTPPFSDLDPMALVHSHIARQPEPPAGPKDLPRQITGIVLKLLQKVPEDRYHDGRGLAADLRRCLVSLDQGTIPDFDLGLEDVPRGFHLPEKLYGRKKETQHLKGVLDLVVQGSRRFINVYGSSGMGRATLVDALRGPVASAGGYFIKGTCDSAHGNVPYDVIGGALRDLVRQIMAESPHEVDQWRASIGDALEGRGRVITDLAPDLALIIGAQEEPPRLDAAEAENRFLWVMQRFLSVFSAEQPLVLVITGSDQLGDAESKLIDCLLTDPSLNHLLIVGTSSKKLEDPGHSLSPYQEKWDGKSLLEAPIRVGPLDTVDIQEMLLDGLSIAPNQSRELADLVRRRTGGGPFDVRVYLKSLHDAGSLRFDNRSGAWTWDESLFSEDTGEDPAGMLTRKIVSLSNEARGVLELASCIGNRFSLRMLSIAWQRSQAETAALLQESLADELIMPVGDAHKLLQVYDPAELEAMEHRGLEIKYSFSHSRIRDMVYSLMEQTKGRESHVRVGRHFLRHSEAHALSDQIFSIVGQLNQGLELIENESERVQLAELNLTAAGKARDAVAFSDAANHYRKGLTLLNNLDPGKYGRLGFSLKLGLAESEYYMGNTDVADTLFEELIQSGEQLTAKAGVYRSRITLMNQSGLFAEAVAAALEGLALFGIHIPKESDAQKAMLQREHDFVNGWLKEHSHKGILNLPRGGDERDLVLHDLLIAATPPAFNADIVCFKLLTTVFMAQVIKRGHTTLSPFVVASYGVVLGFENEYALGYRLGKVSLEISGRFPNTFLKNRLLFICSNLLNPWMRPLSLDDAILNQVRRQCDQNGDLLYANYTASVLLHHKFFSEEPLLGILDQCEKSIVFADRTRNPAVREGLRHLSHIVLNLRGLTLEASSIDAQDFSVVACESRMEAVGYLTGLVISRIFRIQVLVLRGCIPEALDLIKQVKPYLPNAQNTLSHAVYVVYRTLVMVDGYARELVSLNDRDHALEEAEELLQQWANQTAENFGHLHALIQAEHLRAKGQAFKAVEAYNRAVKIADDNGFVGSRALIHHRAGEFMLSSGMDDYATHHFEQAYLGYQEWGAGACCRDLINQRQEWLRVDRLSQGRETKTAVNVTASLDRATLFKAAQALTAEINLDELLRKLMRFVAENAGAQRGVFLMRRDDSLLVEAEWHINNGKVVLHQNESVSSRCDLARPVVHFVFRTRSELLIDDVAKDKQFLGDTYLRDSGVKSILCLPIIRQTDLVGVLYLENHLMPGAFTRDRSEMLRMLAPQIAVSIENARFIGNMAALNENLKIEIREREKTELELKKAQQIALANARAAGKAEFATSVLHNINNILNSVSLACQTLKTQLEQTGSPKLARVADLINSAEDLAHFLTEDKRGKLLPEYITQLGHVLNTEQDEMSKEVFSLEKNIDLMKGIIKSQQETAKGALSMETLDPNALVEDALHIQAENLRKHDVVVSKELVEAQAVQGRKAELVHILVNLVKNAVEAMGFSDERTLHISSEVVDDNLELSIQDSGVGISPKQMARMFTHGYTTKQDGHGFGLAYCKREMQAMKGDLVVRSEGEGKGARFTLVLPLAEPVHLHGEHGRLIGLNN